MSYGVGNKALLLAKLEAQYQEACRQNCKKKRVESEDSDVSEAESDEEVGMTFPNSETLPVVRQHGDLTCGMRCIQNMYGQYITSREEMDEQARQLEAVSKKWDAGCEPMYNKQLGHYSIEVLQAVLKAKGKHTQRIAIEKIPPDYYLDIVEKNPTFVGYIVTLGSGDMKHYVTVRFSSGGYTLINSMPGVKPQMLTKDSMFRTREQQVFCSMDSQDNVPIVALIAVGGSPFVEYGVLHNTWHANPPSPERYRHCVARILNTNLTKTMRRVRQAPAPVKAWYEAWKRQRVDPNVETAQFLNNFVREQFSNDQDVIVIMAEHQTIVQCSSVQDLCAHLVNIQWVGPGVRFSLLQNNRQLQDDMGNNMDIESDGTLEDWGIVEGMPLQLEMESVFGNSANVGGFYTFRCTIAGTCIGQQHNAYSVQDNEGKVHIVYKKCIETIES